MQLKTKPQLSQGNLTQHTVPQDNSIIYKGNIYTVPTGTYKSRETYIWVQAKESKMTIYNNNKEVIARHKICKMKGEIIRNNNHRWDKSTNIQEKEQQAFAILVGVKQVDHFLRVLHKDKPRYYHDHLRIIIDHNSSSK